MSDFDLTAVSLSLEPGLSADKPHTISLYRQDRTSVSLFVFAAGTRLPAHQSKGTVSIHVLQGCLCVTVEDQSHVLRANSLLCLAPDTRHDVLAQEQSHMLLTIHLPPA